jgi:hypothetical protein
MGKVEVADEACEKGVATQGPLRETLRRFGGPLALHRYP